jgi:hypothetical protein
MHWEEAGHCETADHGSVVVFRGRMIEGTIDEEQRTKQPRNGHESAENTLEQLNFLVAQGETFDPHGQTNRREKYYADEDENTVEFQWRIKHAGDEECDRTNQKNGQAVDEIAADGTPRFDGVQAAVIAKIGRAVGAAVSTTGHGWESFQIR